MEAITDLLMENTSVIIVIVAVLVCIIIGYIGDKRFKAKGILEKKENTLSKEESIIESEYVKEESMVEVIKPINESEVPVFDNTNTIISNVVNNSDVMYADSMNQNINNQFNNIQAQPNVMYSDNSVSPQMVSNEPVAQQPVNNMSLSQMANQASSGVQNPAQEFPYSPEDNINNIF